jgi:hypothetical protein
VLTAVCLFDVCCVLPRTHPTRTPLRARPRPRSHPHTQPPSATRHTHTVALTHTHTRRAHARSHARTDPHHPPTRHTPHATRRDTRQAARRRWRLPRAPPPARCWSSSRTCWRTPRLPSRQTRRTRRWWGSERSSRTRWSARSSTPASWTDSGRVLATYEQIVSPPFDDKTSVSEDISMPNRQLTVFV